MFLGAIEWSRYDWYARSLFDRKTGSSRCISKQAMIKNSKNGPPVIMEMEPVVVTKLIFND